MCLIQWLDSTKALLKLQAFKSECRAATACTFLCCHYRETVHQKTRQETGKPHGSSVMSPWQQVRMLWMGKASSRQVAVCSALLILKLHSSSGPLPRCDVSLLMWCKYVVNVFLIKWIWNIKHFSLYFMFTFYGMNSFIRGFYTFIQNYNYQHYCSTPVSKIRSFSTFLMFNCV